MSTRGQSEQDPIRAALGPGQQCLSLDELQQLVSEPATASGDRAAHVKSCAYCQTEMQLLRTFEAGAEDMSEEVRRVTEQLRQRTKPIVVKPLPSTPWWRAILATPRLAQASLAMAAILAVTGIVLQFRVTHHPSLNDTSSSGQEVLRSSGFSVLSPVGDVEGQPDQIRWEKVPKAARYRIRVLEVDQSEVWKAETTDDQINLPFSVRDRIVPAKTLFCEVSAFDSSGNKIGETGLVRFRLVHSVDRH